MQALEVDEDRDEHGEDVAQQGTSEVKDHRKRHVQLLQRVAHPHNHSDIEYLWESDIVLGVMFDLEYLKDTDPKSAIKYLETIKNSGKAVRM